MSLLFDLQLKIDKLKEIHKEFTQEIAGEIYGHVCDTCFMEWPCDTIKILEGNENDN